MEKYVFLQVAVFGLASRPSFPRDPSDDSCLPNSLVPATFEASLFFSSFVDNLQQEDGKGKKQQKFCKQYYVQITSSSLFYIDDKSTYITYVLYFSIYKSFSWFSNCL